MKKMLTDFFTDAKGRWELKNFLGVFSVIAAVASIFIMRDIAVFGALAGFAVTMFTLTTAGDTAIDKTGQ